MRVLRSLVRSSAAGCAAVRDCGGEAAGGRPLIAFLDAVAAEVAAGDCCGGTAPDPLYAVAYARPSAAVFDGEDDFDVVFGAAAGGGAPGYSFKWDSGEATRTITVTVPYVAADASVTRCVTVTDAAGNSAVACATARVHPPLAWYCGCKIGVYQTYSGYAPIPDTDFTGPYATEALALTACGCGGADSLGDLLPDTLPVVLGCDGTSGPFLSGSIPTTDDPTDTCAFSGTVGVGVNARRTGTELAIPGDPGSIRAVYAVEIAGVSLTLRGRECPTFDLLADDFDPIDTGTDDVGVVSAVRILTPP